MMVWETLFWVSISAICYTYFLYPVALTGLARLKGPRQEPKLSVLPSICIVISAFNEESVIGQRVDNLKSIHYPNEKLRILVGSDGSTDRTADILHASGMNNLTTKAYKTRRGKAAVLNDLIALTDAEVVVLSDANTSFAPDAIARLAARFADKAVGAVCGFLELDANRKTAGGLGESSYWNYDNRMKLLESEIATTVAANGSIYAIRRELFRPLPLEKSVSDDLFIPLTILSRGYRVVYEKGARAFEKSPNTVGGEFRRRARIVTRNLYALSEFPELLNPLGGFVPFVLWSRKLVRWSVPLLLLIVLASSAFLARELFFFQIILLGQLGFYMVAIIAWLLEMIGVSLGLFGLPYYFSAMNIAILAGIMRFVKGEEKFTWDPVR